MLRAMPKQLPADAVPVPGGLVQSNVRMPQPALDYLDEWANDVNREAGWTKVTRSDLIRDIVLAAIEDRKGARDRAASEGAAAQAPKPKPRQGKR